MAICISTFSELLQVHNVVGADPIPEDESVGQVMIIIPINTIINIVDVAFIALVIVLIMIMCRQIQEQEATLKVLHKEQAGVKVFFSQQLLQHFVVYLYSPGPGLQAQR